MRSHVQIDCQRPTSLSFYSAPLFPSSRALPLDGSQCCLFAVTGRGEAGGSGAGKSGDLCASTFPAGRRRAVSIEFLAKFTRVAPCSRFFPPVICVSGQDLMYVHSCTLHLSVCVWQNKNYSFLLIIRIFLLCFLLLRNNEFLQSHGALKSSRDPKTVDYSPRKRPEMPEITSFDDAARGMYWGSRGIEILPGPQNCGQ